MVDFLKAMKAKSNDDYNSDAVCVKEYAYCEDMNARMSMEDGSSQPQFFLIFNLNLLHFHEYRL